MDNQHKKIDGYRDFDQETVDAINYIKSLERDVASYWNIVGNGDVDKRELALAKTHFEDAFMHFVKAVAKPVTPW
jgi:hypothetical protein